ncbi:MAG: PAS-domain containing protein [Rhodospirillaceae bacterium]
MNILLPPTILAFAGAIALILIPAVVLLVLQHRAWRRAETLLEATEREYTATLAALNASPDGYFAWIPATAIRAEDASSRNTAEDKIEENTGVCSRRLAVLLDLYRGLDSTFSDVLAGFDGPSIEQLTAAVSHLRKEGRGFNFELFHAATGRRIETRGVRADSLDDNMTVDMIWMSDVTEGVAAVDTLTKENQRLQESNSLLEETLDGLTIPVWLRDDDLSLIYCNAAYVKAVDADSARDVTSRGREIAPRNSIREVRALAAAARASGVTRSAAFHMVIEGSRRLIEVIENPVSPKNIRDGVNEEDTRSLFGDGSGLMTAGVAYDITHQEELETRLHRETASHAEVLERLGTAIAVYAADQRLAFYNTAFTQLWDLEDIWLRSGPSYGDILESLREGRRLPEVADFPAFKETELDRFHSLIDPLEDVLHLPDGGTLRRVIAPHPMGGLLTTYEDVTDTLAMERSYNTLIAVQRETIDNLNQAIAMFSGDGQLQLANPAFLSLWKLSPEIVEERVSVASIVKRMEDSFDTVEDRTHYSAFILDALNPDTERVLQQAHFKKSDDVTFEVTSVPLPDGGALFSFTDITTTP